MPDDRIKIVLSIPKDFSEKFTNFINNINLLNSDVEFPIIIEEVFNDKKMNFAAVPTDKKHKKEAEIENKDQT